MPETFRQAVRRLRAKKRLTQAQVAGACGVVPQTVSAWERGEGRPSGEVCAKLATVLDTDVLRLMRLADVERRRQQFPSWLADPDQHYLGGPLRLVRVFDLRWPRDPDWGGGGFPGGHRHRSIPVLTDDKDAFACQFHPGRPPQHSWVIERGDILVFEPNKGVLPFGWGLLQIAAWGTLVQYLGETSEKVVHFRTALRGRREPKELRKAPEDAYYRPVATVDGEDYYMTDTWLPRSRVLSLAALTLQYRRWDEERTFRIGYIGLPSAGPIDEVE